MRLITLLYFIFALNFSFNSNSQRYYDDDWIYEDESTSHYYSHKPIDKWVAFKNFILSISCAVGCYIFMLTLIRFKTNIVTQILSVISVIGLLISGTWVSITLINLMS